MAKADFVTSIILILLGVGALVESAGMPRFAHLNVDPYTVPGIVPAILSAGLVLLGGILLLRSLRHGGWRLSLQGTTAVIVNDANRRLALTLLLTLGYAIGLVGRLPYWLATGLFVFLFIAAFEWTRGAKPRHHARALGLAALQAVLVAAAVTAVFQLLFLVRLP